MRPLILFALLMAAARGLDCPHMQPCKAAAWALDCSVDKIVWSRDCSFPAHPGERCVVECAAGRGFRPTRR